MKQIIDIITVVLFFGVAIFSSVTVGVILARFIIWTVETVNDTIDNVIDTFRRVFE